LTLARYSIRTGNVKDGLFDYTHANTIMKKNPMLLWKNIPEETFEMRAEFARLLLQYNAAGLESIQDIINELESKTLDKRKKLLVIVLKLRISEFRSDYGIIICMLNNFVRIYGLFRKENSFRIFYYFF
jgi:transcriptional accessory protein Tex/SPT6